jgi:hypothetical protein
MSKGLSCRLILAAALSFAAGGAFAQAGMGSVDGGSGGAGSSKAAPSVDTGAAGTNRFPVRESSDPKTTGSSIVGDPSVNPPGNPPGTIPPNADAARRAGASPKSPCFPETGQAAGTPSRC